MSILDRILANGGEVIRDEWRFILRPGRMTPAALDWVRDHWRDVCCDVWPEYDDWEERAAIREYDGNQPRQEAECAAYAEVTKC